VSDRRELAERVRAAMPDDLRAFADLARRLYGARLVGLWTETLCLGERPHEFPKRPCHDINHPERYPFPDPVVGLL
jgi:hypothetical protein